MSLKKSLDYCCTAAGFKIPFRPEECKTCHLARCYGWEEYALGDRRIEYHKGPEGYVPKAGDIVLYDRVFENKEHDHMGIVLDKREDTILAAEGNGWIHGAACRQPPFLPEVPG